MTLQTEQVPKPNPPRLPSAEDSLAVRIGYERRRHGWSADELAKRMTDAGIPLNPSAVWRIENGTPRRKISLDEAIGFAKVFGLSLNNLIGADANEAGIEQIDAVIYRMRETNNLLQEQRRELKQIITSVVAAAAAQDSAELERIEHLLREIPFLSEWIDIEQVDGEH